MKQGLRKELSFLCGVAALGFLAKRRPNLTLGAGILALGLRFVPPALPYSFKNRVAVITGGSRGLGLALAEQLLHEGAAVSLLARDQAELERARYILDKMPNARVFTFVCDVTDVSQLSSAFAATESRFGRIDILVNNAGSITMAPFESMERKDFDAQMNIHLHAAVNGIQLVLPYLRKIQGGRILNIGSIGAKVPVPHMTSYCASKFALAGFSGALGLELAREGIFITTVHPGLMRTGSQIQAVFKGDQQREFAWFAAMGIMPGLSMAANRAAKKILECLRRADSDITISVQARFGKFIYSNFPEIFSFANSLMVRFLPTKQSKEHKTGAASEALFLRKAWVNPLLKINRRAQERYNQKKKYDAEFNLGI